MTEIVTRVTFVSADIDKPPSRIESRASYVNGPSVMIDMHLSALQRDRDHLDKYTEGYGLIPGAFKALLDKYDDMILGEQ
jgi:hypothetical protein